MSRLRAVPAPTPAEIEAEIKEEAELHAALQRDLNDALLAGEDTRPYRANIGELGEKIARLRRQHDAAVQAEADRRRAVVASTAREIAAGACRRVEAVLENLNAPSINFEIGNAS
jgi:hypothetical protein